MSPRSAITVLVILGFALRVFVGDGVYVPREDGVNYLWMAERFAAGDAGLALSEIFSPLLALVIAVPVACGVEPLRAAQLVLAVAGSLAIVPMARISEHIAPGTAARAALLAFSSPRLVTLGTQVYTEPLFLLVASYAFLCGLLGRYWWCGIVTGVAFWIRPEAALIPLAFFLVRPTGPGWRAFVPLFLAVMSLAIWRGSCGHGFDPVPKLAFIAAHNVAGETDAVGFVLRSFGHLLWIPVRALEAFSWLAFLVLLGIWRGPRCRPAVVLLGLAVIVICCYVPRWRFLVNWMFTILPFAAYGVGRLPWPSLWIALAILVNCALAMNGGVEANRIAERYVAEHLRQEVRAGQTIAGDMTRVLYFAGQRPLQPRHFTAEELVEAGRRAEFVVLRVRRKTTPAVLAGLSGHEVYAVPSEVRSLVESRGIVVLRRR